MIQFEEPLISWMLLAARCCLAAVYLSSGLHKLLFFRQAQKEFRDARVPLVGLFLPLTIALHLVAPIGLIGGAYAREAALLLAAFTVVATVKVHGFWRMIGQERLDHSRIALAHLAIIGGLIMLAAVGPGELTG